MRKPFGSGYTHLSVLKRNFKRLLAAYGIQEE
jgi:hypothetical protein